MDIPETVARQLGDSPESVADSVLKDAALEGYRSGKLSHFQVRTMLGLSSWIETEELLRNHGAPVRYSREDLAEDRRALAAILDAK